MKTTQFFIFGRVQGVGFRFFTLQEAKRIGLKGYVKNREDGSVAIIAQGNEEQMIQLRNWLPVGVKSAKVERIIEQNYHTEANFMQFSIER